MSIGLRIKHLRKECQLSQLDFAEKIGLRQSPLSQMESGKILPSIETLSKIIREFNISYSWLIDGVEKKNTNKKELFEKNEQKEVSNNYDTGIIKSKYFISPPTKITQEEVRMLAVFAVMYKDELEKAPIFSTYLKTIKDKAIIEYQNELMKEFQEKERNKLEIKQV